MQCSTDPDLDVKRSAIKKTARHLIFLQGLLQSVVAVFICLCLLGPKVGCSLFFLSVFVGAKRGVLTVFLCLCLLGPKEGWSLFFLSVFVGAKRGGHCFPLSVFVGARRGVVTVFPVCVC